MVIVKLRSKIITLIIIFAFTLYAGINLYTFWRRDAEIAASLIVMREETAELQQRIADLEFMLENINDPDVMRRIAEEFGLVSPDELIIVDGAGIPIGN